MSWYDNVFLAPPEDEPEELMGDGEYGIYHKDTDYEVVVEDGEISKVYHWDEDGVIKIECSDELTDEDYDGIAEKILEINKNESTRH